MKTYIATYKSKYPRADGNTYTVPLKAPDQQTAWDKAAQGGRVGYRIAAITQKERTQ